MAGADGQSFKLSSSNVLTSAKFWLRKFGTSGQFLSGLSYARLYAHTGTFGSNGMPIGAPLATSDPYQISNLPYGGDWVLVTFTFSGDQQYTLQANVPYVIMFCCPQTGNMTAGINVYQQFSGAHPGNTSYESSCVWHYDNSYDTCFYIYSGELLLDSCPTTHQSVSSLLNFFCAPALPQHNLTIQVTGSGTTDPSVGVHSYNEGSEVPVTAIPGGHYHFDHWTLDTINVGSVNPYTVTMNTDHTLVAIFVEDPKHNLIIEVNGNGTTDPTIGTHSYYEGEEVPVEAIPDEHYHLDHWTLDGDNVGSDNPYIVTMNSDHTLIVIFTEDLKYNLIIEVSGHGTTDPEPDTYTYYENEEIEVEAIANEDYHLCHWTLDGDDVGNDNPYTVLIDNDHILVAIFLHTPSGLENEVCGIEEDLSLEEEVCGVDCPGISLKQCCCGIECPTGEQITNGGFEIGDLDNWIFLMYAVEKTSYEHHSGSYSCSIGSTGGCSPTYGWIEQDIASIKGYVIPVSCITSFTAWVKTCGSGNCIKVTYSDDSETIISVPEVEPWTQINILSYLDSGKSVSKVKFYRNGPYSGIKYLDDVSLIC